MKRVNAFRNMEFLEKEFNGINSMENYLISERQYLNGKTESINLPKSDVVKVRFDDDSWFAIRPSGTEPKLKIYISSLGRSSLISQLKLIISNL